MELTIANVGIAQDAEGRYCLNDLHKAAIAGGANARTKEPSKFLSSPQTTELVSELLNTQNLGVLYSGENGVHPVSKTQGSNGGTFVAKELVYAYAMWISPSFHLKVIRTFDAIATAPASDPGHLMTIMGHLGAAMEMLTKETFVSINAIRKDLDEVKQSIANPGAVAQSYSEGWKPTHTITPKNPENILYKRFVEVCGNGGNLNAWWRKSGLKLSAYTVTKVLYHDVRPSPATFAVIANALGFSKGEIKSHLQTNYKNCGFLALL